ncbi:MAG: adenylate/guanylate cyclase domain-containing protein [Gammaproteobacteria bacterium]|nr:adenylate/guanylate cyclase domain-containing protein [Gammaproteobacteria bacterium]
MMPIRHVLPGTVVLMSIFLCCLLLSSGFLQIDVVWRWSGVATDYADSRFLLSIDADSFKTSPILNAYTSIQFWLTQFALFSLTLITPLFRPRYALSIFCGYALVVGLAAVWVLPSIVYQAYVCLTLVAAGYGLFFLVSEAREKHLLTLLFSRFVPPALIQRFNLDQRAFYLDTEPKQLTILFCDIHSFTTISERMSPALLAQWLGEYFEVVTQVIELNHGTIDKYMGDSVMAIWGAPESQPNHANHALSAAHQIMSELAFLNRKLEAIGLPPVKVGVGVASGVCNVGIMGSHERRSYTVVGDVVNTAQRLEKLTRRYSTPILFNETTAVLATEWPSQELGSEYVRGRKRFVSIYKPKS